MSNGPKTVEDTGWKPIKILTGDGDRDAGGRVEMVKGDEKRPCVMCLAWEKDDKRLIEHLLSRGLTPRPDGTFVTPIAKDFPGRKSLVLDPKKMGFCRLQTIPTEDLATCEEWKPVTTMSQLQSRIK